MIIREVKRILTERKEATVHDLAIELGCGRSMVLAALDYWTRRGMVEAIDPTVPVAPAFAAASPSCGSGCDGCALVATCVQPQTFFRWVAGSGREEETTLTLWMKSEV